MRMKTQNVMNITEHYLHILKDNPQKFQDPLIPIFIVFSILLFLTCILGIVGNGTVFWLLGFRMKRTPFTTYILHLAIADSGVLILTILEYINVTYDFIIAVLYHKTVSPLKYYIFYYVVSLFYNTDQFILTAISADRCVVVLFPVWHRCHRRPHLSRTVCVFAWVLSFLLSGLDVLLIFATKFTWLLFIVNVVICTPLMAICAIILFATLCLKSQRQKRGKLVMTIFLALFFFLIFGFPVNYLSSLIYYDLLDGLDGELKSSADLGYSSTVIPIVASSAHQITIPEFVAFACIVLNCSVNPLIYFLVGRDKKNSSRLSIKVALQRLFKGEENCRGEERLQAENQV